MQGVDHEVEFTEFLTSVIFRNFNYVTIDIVYNKYEPGLSYILQ